MVGSYLLEGSLCKLTTSKHILLDILVSGGLPPRPEKSPDEKKSNYKQILSLRTIHVLSFFILCYCGAEVTVGG